MKAFIVALALLVAPMGASAQPSGEQCVKIATVIFFVAEGRDLGSSPDVIYTNLLAQEIPVSVARNIINNVFFWSPDVTPTGLANDFLNYCTSEAL